ncbi:MAG: 7-cyano-7-deazaguanine synthase QueC [Bdellovibrionota bacterium]
MMTPSKKELVVFSGGQDSTTCLLWALKNFKEVEAVNFDYGQRHTIERECALKIAQKLNVPYHEVNLGFLQTLSTNSLTSETEISLSGGYKDLPSTFVVGRNALFLTVAVSFGLPRGFNDFVFGACQVDYSGYPDCREEFIQSQAKTLSLATDSEVKLHTPLMNLTKADTFALAADLGGLDLVLEDSHTCYKGERSTRHSWGYGCGTCPACDLRRKGFEEYGRSRR